MAGRGRGRGPTLELLSLGGTLECQRRAVAARDDLGHVIEIRGPHLALVPRGRVALTLGLYLALLQLGVRSHPALLIATRQLEHAVVQRMEAGQRDELELVTHRPQLALEAGDVRLR